MEGVFWRLGLRCLFLSSIIFALFTDWSAALLEKHSDLNVVIDTDAGADDAMAILLLLSKQSKTRVHAITTVYGNTGVENATRNVFLTLRVANRPEIPVFMGSPQGLVYEEKSNNFFGYDGLSDVFMKPTLDQKKAGHSALALVNLVMSNPGQISVLCIGPLTNIALAIHLYPEFLSEVKEVVILGGSIKGRGNIRLGAEFNMFMDPEAADFVFSKVPEDNLVTLIPLETFEDFSYPMSWRLKELGKVDSGFMRFLNKAERMSISKSGETWMAVDPAAAAILLDPSIAASTKNARVAVETSGRLSRGAMVVDFNSNCSNARVVTSLARVQLQSMLLTYLAG